MSSPPESDVSARQPAYLQILLGVQRLDRDPLGRLPQQCFRWVLSFELLGGQLDPGLRVRVLARMRAQQRSLQRLAPRGNGCSAAPGGRRRGCSLAPHPARGFPLRG